MHVDCLPDYVDKTATAIPSIPNACLFHKSVMPVLYFELYTGNKDSGTECGIGERVVLDLVCHFKNNNHVVYCDTLCGSMTLAKKLASQVIFLAATTRSTRKDFPPQLKQAHLLK